MELRVLNYFLVIAREENFTRAAQQLHVTQPTLSRQIADLEQELGVRLFTRGSHNLALTEDGMILKRRAQEILTLADKTKRDFLHKEKNLEGTISIGSGEFLSTRILTDCVAAFREKYPRVRYEIHSGNTGNIREQIERGLLDLGLVTEPVDIRKYEFVTMPVKERWGVLVREDSPLAAGEMITPEDLAGCSLVGPANEMAQGAIMKWLGTYAAQTNIIATGNLLYNEALLAQSSPCVVVTMQLNCVYNGLRFLPLSPVLEGSTALIWKKEQIFPAAAAAFIEFAGSYVRRLSEKVYQADTI